MKKLLFLVLFLFPLIAYPVNYNNDANCMGSWPMENDGDETDLSGESETLTETSGDIPQDADKMFGTYSRDFERGETEYLTHADGGSTDISGVDQKLSIVYWLKREADSGGYELVVGKYDYGNNQRSYQTGVNINDRIYFAISPDGTSGNAEAVYGDTDPYPVGAWHHTAVVYNDIDMRVYYDGSLDCSPNNHTGGIHAGTAAFNVGCVLNNGSPADHADGLVDDVGIFDRELSSVEVSDIDTNGMAGAAVTRKAILLTKR